MRRLAELRNVQQWWIIPIIQDGYKRGNMRQRVCNCDLTDFQSVVGMNGSKRGYRAAYGRTRPYRVCADCVSINHWMSGVSNRCSIWSLHSNVCSMNGMNVRMWSALNRFNCADSEIVFECVFDFVEECSKEFRGCSEECSIMVLGPLDSSNKGPHTCEGRKSIPKIFHFKISHAGG